MDAMNLPAIQPPKPSPEQSAKPTLHPVIIRAIQREVDRLTEATNYCLSGVIADEVPVKSKVEYQKMADKNKAEIAILSAFLFPPPETPDTTITQGHKHDASTS